jgi:predicted adenylyl cyclase CyaB
MDEVELKFRLAGDAEHQRLRDTLQARGARRIGTDQEENLLFDDRDERLTEAGSILRVRLLDGGPKAKLTYKGAARYDAGVKRRQEIEVAVADGGATRELLEALGYHVDLTYTKQRETWQIGESEVALDTLVFGHFCEIEGPEAEIRDLARALDLDEAQAEAEGYPSLMARYADALEGEGEVQI